MAEEAATLTALVIDDDQLTCEYAQTALSAAGFKTDCALTGEQGLAAMAQSMPRLLLLDMRLPGMQGIDVLRALRHSGGQAPVVIGMSAAWAENEKAAIDLGAAAFLRKPLNARDLVTTVELALRGRLVWIDD